MEGDPFETVAIAYSQPQAGVILSLFAWHGIPAYGMNLETIRVNTPWTLALGGIPIRAHRDYAEEARGLLAEAADVPDEAAAEPVGERVAKVIFCGVFGLTPPPKMSAEIVARR